MGLINVCEHQFFPSHSIARQACKLPIAVSPVADYISFPITELVRIPTGLDLRTVSPILCAGVTAYTSLRMMNTVPGKWCAIVGAAGGLGHLAIQYARSLGLRVLAIDGGLFEKESFCLRMGAEVYVDFTNGKLVERVLEKTQGGPDYVLVLSPHQSCYEFVPAHIENIQWRKATDHNDNSDACDYVQFGGQIMAVGIGNAQ